MEGDGDRLREPVAHSEEEADKHSEAVEEGEALADFEMPEMLGESEELEEPDGLRLGKSLIELLPDADCESDADVLADGE